MAEQTTGAMQQFATPGSDDEQGSQPGLVLLFADDYAALPAAVCLHKSPLTLGREGVDILVVAPAVSRNHAELRYVGQTWRLRDLGSRNGTLVDGRRISEIELEPAHEIRIGDAIFKFVRSRADQYARYRIDGKMVGDARRKSQHETSLVGGYQIDLVTAELERVAPADLSVMVLGESGTGKEVVARELHRLSGRPGRFCAINCAAIPGSLIESELFGFKRGAFSGANRDKPGLIQSAHRGTLLLDEIGDMPAEAQAKLLRVLQSKEVLSLGSTTAEHVDVRIISATHRDLMKLQATGRFRADLFARLNEYKLWLVPLRERKEDIFQLCRAFLARQGRPELKLSFAYMTGLLNYDWPYNVRELESCIKRSVALCQSDTLMADQLPDAIRDAMQDYGQAEPTPGTSASKTESPPAHAPPTATPSAEALRDLLSKHHGNVAAVGRELGKARMQVHRWMRRYSIDIADYRQEQ